ncbi:MAG TPA: metal-dependent hydrolase [Solirubrobacterales bacterium]|nr:metal-dependent hydrolase [Solirubrobacterales bacterium]
MPAAALVAAVLALDLLWSLIEGSTGTIAYGLIDEPAHLATCVVVLFAATAVKGSRFPARFVTAALIASVAIDLDHVPGYLGSHLITGSMPRPYTHSLLFACLLLVVGLASKRPERRQVWLGIAFGVSAHLLRDVATGPGIAFLWPIVAAPIKVSYVLYAGTLLIAVIAVIPRRSLAAAQAAAVLALALVALLAFVPSGASAHRIALGTYIRGIEDSPGLLDRYTQEVGRPPAIVGAYKRWDVQPFYAPELEQIADRGAVPMIGWEPWNEADHGFRLAAIAKGHYDDYITRSAREAKAWGGPILVRLGQEMNGSWAPWQRGVNGTTGPRFVAAWRHVVGIFRHVGATNVSWVWCPYVNNGKLPFMNFYPGDKWVDWLALDGFNWGEPTAWQPFPKIFDTSYRALAHLARKPIMIAEIGSDESGGSKAAWLRRTLNHQLPRLKRVKAVVWFNATDGADFRVDSSPDALAAFREGIGSPLYSGDAGLVNRVSQRAARLARLGR